MRDGAAARQLLDQLAAEPRPAGSAAEARVRAICAQWLRTRGFSVREQPFEYSALPGQWMLVTVGVIAVVTAVAIVPLPGGRVYAVPLALLALGALTLVSHHWVLASPFARRSSVNLIAVRGAPRVWLTAHLDSKSQPLSMRGRILAVAAVVLGFTMVSALWLGSMAGWFAGSGAWQAGGGLLALGGVPLLACTVGDRSPGAVDDAAGVAAVLLAVDAAGEQVGVVLTSAEELMLAGARRWALDAEPGTVVNVDGVADEGEVRCILHRGASPGLAAELARAGRAAGVRVRGARMPVGVLMDSVPFARAGWRTVAVSRVSWSVLGRIHTRADTADRLTGEGILEVASVLAEYLRSAE